MLILLLVSCVFRIGFHADSADKILLHRLYLVVYANSILSSVYAVRWIVFLL